MKNTWLTLLFFLLLIGIFSMPLLEHAEASKGKTEKGKVVERQTSCPVCHDDFTGVLPKTHSPVKGNALSVCMECHAPEGRGMAEADKFEVRLHLAHLKSPGKTDCLDCHTWKPGQTFGLTGIAGSYGALSAEDMALLKQMFTSVLESDFLFSRHFSKGIPCRACHGKDILGGNAVENTRCLACHRPVEQLIAKTAPKDFPDRNPHKSHLGEISCTVCHAGHAEAKIYCLECHPKFDMKLK